mgnify:CR=1 FL=1
MISKPILYVLCLAILVMQLVAITTTDWSVKTSGNNATSSMGLWNFCLSNVTCTKLPGSLPNFPLASLQVVRTFAILGAICTLLSFGFIYMDSQYQLPMIALSGVCSLIASVVWAIKLLTINKVEFTVGYSFFVNLIAGMFGLGLSGYLYMEK